MRQTMLIAFAMLFVLGCVGSQAERCNDWLCVVNHIKTKQCAPLIYEYDGKTLEIQDEVRDSSGYLQACKVRLKWSDGTEMTCYPKYIGDFELIKMGFPQGNCTGSYIDAGCAGRCGHANSTNKTI